MTHTDRILTMLGVLLLFTLNEVHFLRDRPRMSDAAHGLVHPATVRAWGGASDVYLSTPDVALRWGLALLVVSLACWVLQATLQPQKRERA